MFTGIVEEAGKVVAFDARVEAWRLQVAVDLVAKGTAVGDSIAVNGCCLTVVERTADRLSFDVLEESRRLTDFHRLQPGAAVNLERAMPTDGRMGGHFVTGHIDALGQVEVLERRGKDYYLRIRVPAGFGRYLVYKGSIAVDGISLTVAEEQDDTLALWLIPHTLAVTNLREKRVGDAVNLEFDLLAKYIEKLGRLKAP